MIIQISEAAPDQAGLVHQIMQIAFAEYLGRLNPPSPCHTETVEEVAAAMRDGGAVLAWLDGSPVGSARFALHSDHFLVARVSVLPEYRGCGVASAMLSYLETIARRYGYTRMQLGSRLSLARNVSFYQRLGYHIVESYQLSPDADVQVTMVKSLPVPAVPVLPVYAFVPACPPVTPFLSSPAFEGGRCR